MAQQIVLSGIHDVQLSRTLNKAIHLATPRVIGIASGFVSVLGVELFAVLIRRQKIQECRLVAGIDPMITHPKALENAMTHGWNVRIGKSHHGIFHPKLIIGGQRFEPHGRIVKPSFFYLGSGNLTETGLTKNVECSILMWHGSCIGGLSEIFSDIWQTANRLTSALLRKYSKEFASQSRSQKLRDLHQNAFSDSGRLSNVSTQRIKNVVPPKHGAMTGVLLIQHGQD